MLPPLWFQIITLTADGIIVIFVGYYFWKIHLKEKELEKKENKIDTNYHQVVDNALSRERKILEDATNEAGQIITGAHYLSDTSKSEINQTLQTVVVDIQKEAQDIARSAMADYESSLKQLTNQSLTDFQTIIKSLETDLQKQIKDFHEALLPSLEKELDEYKQSRLQQIDQTIIAIVQKASQEILNKSLPIADHHKLLMDSLEKAKKEGAFG